MYFIFSVFGSFSCNEMNGRGFSFPIHLPSHKVTIKGGSRRAEKSRKVPMKMKAAKLGWAGPGVGQEQTMSRPGAGWEQARSGQGALQEQGRNISSPHTKFHPNSTKNVETKKICYWSALIGWSSQSEK